VPDVIAGRHFDHVFRIVSHPSFLARKGLGNEVPFFVDTYAPESEPEVAEQIQLLHKRLTGAGIATVCLPMFEVVMETVSSIKSIEAVLEYEKKTPKTRPVDRKGRSFQDQMEAWTNPEQGKRLQTAIRRRLEEQPDHQLVLMHQLGAVYPYLRTHTLLSNLHAVITETPLVVFFPGEYVSSERDGYYFSLFGKFRSEYYRAFRLEDYIERGKIRADIT
jgi:hypothetical protein